MRESNYWLRLIVSTKRAGHERAVKLVPESRELIAILTTIVKNTRRE